MNNYRVCNKCKQQKSTNDFYRRLDDLQRTCKICQKTRRKLDYQKNPEKEKEKARNWRLQNPEKTAAMRLAWKRKNKEKNLASVIRYQKANPDKHNIASKKYRLKNQDKYNNYANERRAKKLKNGVFKITDKDFKKLQSQSCQNCGTQKNLTIDHIIPISRGGTHSIGNLQMLCGFCNSSKSNKVMIVWRKINDANL